MANTNYFEIIELVLALTKSYEIDGIFDKYSEDGLLQLLRPYFKFAAGELEISDSGIDTSRDDELIKFNNELTDGEQLIFAKYVLIGYLTKDKNDILQMRLHLQDGDFKTFAEANNLNAKTNSLEILKEEVGWNVKKSEYKNTNVWGCDMESVNISVNDTNSYIDMLINQSFSILPLYEENGNCQILTRKIDNLFHRLNGFFKMNKFDANITIDILSFINELKDSDNHEEIRCCVLKICSLLSRLKVVI